MRAHLGFKRIATEEAFATKGLIKAYRDLLARQGSADIGFNSLMGYYLNNPSERTRAVSARLETLGQPRIDDMDATGIDMQILSLTCPGVQIFDAPTGVAVARDVNDELAAAIAAHPTRYAGLAAIAPQDPAAAASRYRISCDGDYAPGCTLLGNRYAIGDGVPADRDEAERLYSKACEAGDKRGCDNLNRSKARRSR